MICAICLAEPQMRPWFMATNAAATTFPLRSVDSTMKKAVAAILFRSHGFRSVTADDVRTLAAITRMEEFRREDRFL